MNEKNQSGSVFRLNKRLVLFNVQHCVLLRKIVLIMSTLWQLSYENWTLGLESQKNRQRNRKSHKQSSY